jgi:hypothetical protein
MATNGNESATENGQNGQSIFYCNICDYYASRKYHFDRHLLSPKHTKSTNDNETGVKGVKWAKYDCPNCKKIFNDRSGLWRHKKKCIVKNDNSVHIDKDEIIKYLMKENGEFKELLMEQNKMVMKVCEKNSIDINNINNTTINSNNKTFNLNVFLNEQCKDAMNIMDFVDSLKIQLSDLENVGKLGFVEGITNIIIKNLRALDVHKRPVHCSDTKREVMYVKDENKWEKENVEKKKLKKAIKHIAHKNSKLLPEFKAKYPDCMHSDSKKSDQYNKLIIEAMGGHGDDSVQEDKIIKNIAKEVTIDKNE